MSRARFACKSREMLRTIALTGLAALIAATTTSLVPPAQAQIVSNLLTNAAKYAEATRASVTMSTASGLVRVEVADDGRGGADAALGTGLRGLADRVEALGGSLEVESRPGCGTTLRAQLPLGVACDAAAPVCTVGCLGRQRPALPGVARDAARGNWAGSPGRFVTRAPRRRLRRGLRATGPGARGGS